MGWIDGDECPWIEIFSFFWCILYGYGYDEIILDEYEALLWWSMIFCMDWSKKWGEGKQRDRNRTECVLGGMLEGNENGNEIIFDNFFYIYEKLWENWSTMTMW